jgi:hypothetical protein
MVLLVTLVFNNKNHRNIQWTEDGSIVAALGFGVNNRIENVFLDHEDIVAVFSSDAKVKFERWDVWDTKESSEEIQKSTELGKPTFNLEVQHKKKRLQVVF